MPHTCGSVSSNAFEWPSQSADSRMSASRIQPLLLLNANMLQLSGWKSADVITCRLHMTVSHPAAAYCGLTL